jgi:hypothetical protein
MPFIVWLPAASVPTQKHVLRTALLGSVGDWAMVQWLVPSTSMAHFVP